MLRYAWNMEVFRERRHRARHARCFFALGADYDNVNFGDEWRHKLDRDFESVCMSIQKEEGKEGKGRKEGKSGNRRV